MTYSDIHHWLETHDIPQYDDESQENNWDHALDVMISCSQDDIVDFDVHSLVAYLAHHYDMFKSDLLKEYDEWCVGTQYRR